MGVGLKWEGSDGASWHMGTSMWGESRESEGDLRFFLGWLGEGLRCDLH